MLSKLFRASPLQHQRYRIFYLGSVGAALGFTMQATVAAWLMATLTRSELMVALVQTASTAPAIVFGLLGGALADILDRRRIILVTQLLLIAATGLLGVATIAGMIGPISLLALTFLIGATFIFYIPAQQATINDLVPRAELSQAVTLSAVAFNVARAVGPALAGAIAAALGSGSAFLASAAMFLLMIVAVRGWSSSTSPVAGLAETLFSGVRSGLRYAWHSDSLRGQIVRSVSFSLCASALWALLPVLARDHFALGAGGFGVLFGCFGGGAVVGALSIPGLLRRASLNSIVNSGVVLWVIATLTISWSTSIVIGIIGAVVAGVAWVTVHATISAATQSCSPAWVRARAVATVLVAVHASMAVSSVAWGGLASLAGARIAIIASAVVLLVLLAATRGVRVSLGQEEDVTSTQVHLPDLAIAVPPLPDDGPVLIQVEYRIDAENRSAFLSAIHAIEPMRRRNGASTWRIFRDLAEEGRFVERYIITSWAEYVRLRSRSTIADQEMQDNVARLQRPDVPIRISRLIGLGEPGARPG